MQRIRCNLVGAIAVMAGLLAGCAGELTVGYNDGGPSDSSTGGAAGASSGGSSSAGSSSTGGTSSGTSSGGGSSTGTTTSAPLPPFVDGGYVFCSVVDSPQGGPFDDGGAASWMCIPGTYFCDLVDPPGNCFQCRSDADCANTGLPTYDPTRPRCDLLSGVPGFQNFCQVCTTSADCAGNPEGKFCDLNPSWTLATLTPLGFETCSNLETDCRVDAGFGCASEELCNPDTGGCVYGSLSFACTSDADCRGLTYDAQDGFEPAPYCFQANCRTSPSGYFGNEEPCSSDADCGNPDGSVAGLTCVANVCRCTSSTQCGGDWPVCLALDAGEICGCDDDQACGDAGWICAFAGTDTSHCIIPCTAPDAPPCSTYQDVCEPDSGICQPCQSDGQCRASGDPTGFACGAGICGCYADSDCPAGEACQANYLRLGFCGPPLPRCTPATCQGEFCDWDSGACTSSFACVSDYDCLFSGGEGPVGGAVCLNGSCVQCRTNEDCIAGPISNGYFTATSHCADNTCTTHCDNDSDCIGNSQGPTCVTDETGDGYGSCVRNQCHNDSQCSRSVFGPFCIMDAGVTSSCGCTQASDCPAGEPCNTKGGPISQCNPCFSNADCPPGELCAPDALCRPHCDDGGQCDPDRPLCDTGNLQGQNGMTGEFPGTAPGVVWCYACVASTDCPAAEGCTSIAGRTCAPCYYDSDCASGGCFNGTCLSACDDAGACPSGGVCDLQWQLNPLGLPTSTNFCFQCLSPIDCPDGEGCDSLTRTCGGCAGPADCPPGDVCSNYWGSSIRSGACLQPCDDRSCPSDRPICAVLPGLTPDHSFCFGCLTDADCADAGAGALCDTTVTATFICQTPAVE